jgi:hypothetical protein
MGSISQEVTTQTTDQRTCTIMRVAKLLGLSMEQKEEHSATGKGPLGVLKVMFNHVLRKAKEGGFKYH